jgi:uncharacterized membrane protein
MTNSRLEAFSDGVFAVAITLLIFEVQVPKVTEAELGRALSGEWPSFASYVVSFLSIGIIWVNHHGLFARVRRIDRNLLFFNLALLLVVAFLPFPTALLGQYIQVPQAATIATIIYGFTMLLLSVAFIATWAYVSFHDGFLDTPFDPEAARARLPRFGLGLLGYGIGILLALVNPELSLLMYGAMAVYYLFDHLPDSELPAAEASVSENRAT